MATDAEDWEALQREGLWRRWKAAGGRRSDVWLRLGIVDGRLACTGMVVEPIDGDLAARDLRDIRVTELIALAGADGIAADGIGHLTVVTGSASGHVVAKGTAAGEVTHHEREIHDAIVIDDMITGTHDVTQDDQTLSAEGTVTPPTDQTGQIQPAVEHDMAMPVTVHPGPKGHPPTHFQLVAHHYRAALLHRPRSPIKWLAEYWHTSDATMRRWVKRARELGYLRDDE